MVRPRRALPVALSTALLAATIAACTPLPSPPSQPCQSASTPSANSYVAIVDEGGTRPVVRSFQAANPTEVQQRLGAISRLGTVLAQSRDELVTTLASPAGSNPYYFAGSAPNQWSFQSSYVDYATAWNTNTQTGTNVRIAVLDTGVDASHPDLGGGNGHVAIGRDFIAGDAVSNYGRIDGNGHGTHVAGIIAAVDDDHPVVGGAFDATIVPGRILDCTGSGSTGTVADGIMWAADQSANGGRADVINLSIGGPGSPGGVLQSAINYALSQNVVVVAAAGNCGSGCTFGNTSYPPNTVMYPGASIGVIAVGATGNLNHARASYSNSNTYVAIAAPGSSIVSTFSSSPSASCSSSPASGYCTLSGTSMATPHVSAVAALVLAKCPADTPTQVRTRILASTDTVTGFTNPMNLVKAGTATDGACP